MIPSHGEEIPTPVALVDRDPLAAVVSRVVVPVNGYPPNDRALPVASALADQFGAEMEIVSMLFDASHHVERTRMLQRVARSVQLASIGPLSVRTTLGQGTDPSAFILDLVRDRSSLVVLAGGTTTLGIPGSTTSDLVRFASAPTVLVGPRATSWQGPVSRIVVPVDGSALSRHALPTAVSWCLATGASCVIVRVVDPHDRGASGGPQATQSVAAHLEALAADVGSQLGRTVGFEAVEGATAERAQVIADLASGSGSLICMASKGSRDSHAMISGTTLGVLHLSTVPVLVTRS